MIVQCAGSVSGTGVAACANRMPRRATASRAGVLRVRVPVASEVVGARRIEGDQHHVRLLDVAVGPPRAKRQRHRWRTPRKQEERRNHARGREHENREQREPGSDSHGRRSGSASGSRAFYRCRHPRERAAHDAAANAA